MKKLLLLLIIFLSFDSSAQFELDQESRYYTDPPTHIERYNVDYTLINYTFINGDSTILLNLDLDNAEEFRSKIEDVIYHDTINNVDILLFFEKKLKN